jgi:hypothetical protein
VYLLYISLNSKFYKIVNNEIAEILISGLKDTQITHVNLSYYKIIKAGAEVLVHGLKDFTLHI